ncbi:MAG: hypothetical protein ABFD69_16465 [Candidatus Sumerlaeia bacterium]
MDDGNGPRHVWRWAAIVAVAAFVSCMSLADCRGLWLDEYITLKSTQFDYGALVTERLDAGHSPVYFIYAKLLLWNKGSEHALRFTSALMAAINILTLTGFALSLRLRRALPALWLVALFMPYWLLIGTEYRYMMFLTAAVNAMLWLAMRYMERPGGRRGLALAAMTAFVAWIHASAHLVIVLTAIFIAAEARREKREFGAAIAAWPILAGWATAIPFLIRIAGHKSISKTSEPELGGMLANFAETILGNMNSLSMRIGSFLNVLFALLLVFLVIAIIGSRRILIATGRKRAWRLLAVLLAGMPICFFAFCIGFKNHQGPVRYVATYAIPCAVCLAVYVSAAWDDRRLRPLATAGAALLMIQAVLVGISPGEMLRETIRWIAASSRPQDTVLISQIRLPKWMFAREGFKNEIVGINRDEMDRNKIAAEVKKHSKPGGRGFCVLYHTRAPVRETLKDMRKVGTVLDFRRVKVSGSVTLLVWISSPTDSEWLEQVGAP